MKFSVVQTRKKNTKPQISVVPTRWIIGEIVKFPRTNWVALSHDPNSTPENDWVPFPAKVLDQDEEYEGADKLLDRYQSITDSDDAIKMTRGTRNTPAVKKKLDSNPENSLLGR